MANDKRGPQTFVERVLALLEQRFLWLRSGQDEPVSGAETHDELCDLHRSLIEKRKRNRREDGGPES